MNSARRFSEWDSLRTMSTATRLTETYLPSVVFIINAFVDNDRQSRLYAESVFRLLDPRLCHTPIELYQVLTRFVVSLTRTPGLPVGMDPHQAVCLLFREVLQLDYADIVEVTQLSRDDVAGAIAQARALLSTGWI